MNIPIKRYTDIWNWSIDQSDQSYINREHLTKKGNLAIKIGGHVTKTILTPMFDFL